MLGCIMYGEYYLNGKHAFGKESNLRVVVVEAKLCLIDWAQALGPKHLAFLITVQFWYHCIDNFLTFHQPLQFFHPCGHNKTFGRFLQAGLDVFGVATTSNLNVPPQVSHQSFPATGGTSVLMSFS